MSLEKLESNTLDVTRQCLDLVARGEYEQYLILETERRSLMEQLLAAGSHNLEMLQQINQASAALEAELEGLVLTPRAKDTPGPYESGDSSSYSAEA